LDIENASAEEMGHSMAEHAAHEAHRKRMLKWLIGGAILTTALVAAPHVLPNISDIFKDAGDAAIDLCTDAANGKGLAGWVSNVLSNVPGIGSELAKGGWVNGIVSAGVGIGGALIGSYLDKQEDGSTKIKWGKVIRTAALATSIFVSLPATLPAITMGLVFLSHMTLPEMAARTVSGGIIDSLGYVKEMFSGGAAGLAAGSVLWPHLLSCGVSFGLGTTAIGAGAEASKRSREGRSILGKHTERLLDERAVKEPEMNSLPAGEMPAHVHTSPVLSPGYAPAR